MTQKTAVIFGGTGFVGRHIVRDMAAKGWRIKIATRVPESAYYLKPAGDVGQIVPVTCDYSDYNAVTNLIKGADYVINCIGILFEKRKDNFTRVHSDLPESIATACAVEKVSRFVHISALGIDQSSSKYAASKREGETRILKAFPNATILRPSVIFGEDDNFFNQFAQLAAFLPALPLIGGGHTKFQPVYVGDIAEAVLQALTLPVANGNSPQGQIYECGGPDILTFREIYEKLFSYTNQKRCLISLPFGIAKIQASFLSLLPTPLLTRDQVESLKTDNIVSPKAKTLADLNVPQTPLDSILPTYLSQYKPGGRFAA